MDASKQPVKLVKVTRVLGRTGTKTTCSPKDRKENREKSISEATLGNI